jgi:copper resistance protein B
VKAAWPLAWLAVALANPAAAQSMPGMDMGSMKMPAKPAKPAQPKPSTPRPSVKPPADPHAGHDMASMPATDAPTTAPESSAPVHDMAAMPGMATPQTAATANGATDSAMSASAVSGTALPAGDGTAPAPPTDRAADRYYGARAMAATRAALQREHGGQTLSMVQFNLAELQVRDRREGYRWDGEGWFGGDIDRVVVKSEGRGDLGGTLGEAEVQALYSRAIGPYFNLQAGVRQDIRPQPARTYATVGFEGLAPYWFEVAGALFLSDKGDVLARAEGYYDQRITQRLILQPRVELNFAAQDVRTSGIGAGLSDAELGLRLRYEIKREFAPYVGVSYDAKVGRTARFARANGERVRGASLVLGMRTWF